MHLRTCKLCVVLCSSCLNISHFFKCIDGERELLVYYVQGYLHSLGFAYIFNLLVLYHIVI